VNVTGVSDLWVWLVVSGGMVSQMGAGLR